MKRFIRIVSILVVALMVFAIPALAAEQASDFFGSHSCYFWNVSSTGFQVWFDVTAVETMDALGVSEIKIQRSSDGVNWKSVQTYGSILSSDTSFASGHVTYSSRESGYYYRAKVTFYAENDSGVGKYTTYTSSI